MDLFFKFDSNKKFWVEKALSDAIKGKLNFCKSSAKDAGRFQLQNEESDVLFVDEDLDFLIELFSTS